LIVTHGDRKDRDKTKMSVKERKMCVVMLWQEQKEKEILNRNELDKD